MAYQRSISRCWEAGYNHSRAQINNNHHSQHQNQTLNTTNSGMLCSPDLHIAAVAQWDAHSGSGCLIQDTPAPLGRRGGSKGASALSSGTWGIIHIRVQVQIAQVWRKDSGRRRSSGVNGVRYHRFWNNRSFEWSSSFGWSCRWNMSGSPC